MTPYLHIGSYPKSDSLSPNKYCFIIFKLLLSHLEMHYVSVQLYYNEDNKKGNKPI